MAIQELARSMDVSVHLTDIFEYIQNFWLNIIHPDGFSVFGLNIRTNNFIESFHSMLKASIGQHPPVWTFWGDFFFINSITDLNLNNRYVY